jgi:hypothetical protein
VLVILWYYFVKNSLRSELVRRDAEARGFPHANRWAYLVAFTGWAGVLIYRLFHRELPGIDDKNAGIFQIESSRDDLSKPAGRIG